MPSIDIVERACKCKDKCLHLIHPLTSCINYIAQGGGDIRVQQCPNHVGETWHKDGKCLKCTDPDNRR